MGKGVSAPLTTGCCITGSATIELVKKGNDYLIHEDESGKENKLKFIAADTYSVK